MKVATVILAIYVLVPGIAKAEQSETVPTSTQTVLLHQKLRVEQPEIAEAGPSVPFEGYATIRYSVGRPGQKQYIREIVEFITRSLPGTFGNSEGTYIITITVTDSDGKLLTKEPLLSFQWTKQAGILPFIQKSIEDVQKTSWSGTLIDNVPVGKIDPSTGKNPTRVKAGIEVFIQQGRSLDFDVLKQTAKALSAAGSVLPAAVLPAAAVPFIDSIGSIINSIYSNSSKHTLVDIDEVPLSRTNSPIAATIKFPNYEIPVYLTVETRQSLFGDIEDGKFKTRPDDSIFYNASMKMTDSKYVKIIELVTTSSDPAQKSTRAMLDILNAGGTYGKDLANRKEENVGVLCNNLYDALATYLSTYDALAMYWIFLNRYGNSLNKSACLGAQRKAGLARVGLEVD